MVRDFGSALRQLGDQRQQVVLFAAADDDVALRHRRRNEERSGLDAVGDDGVVGAVQPGHAVDADGRGPGALDSRAHGVQQGGQIADLRLARRVGDHRLPVGEHGRHHYVLGAGHGDAVEG